VGLGERGDRGFTGGCDRFSESWGECDRSFVLREKGRSRVELREGDRGYEKSDYGCLFVYPHAAIVASNTAVKWVRAREQGAY